jgi:hypothetical protein
VNVVGHEAIRVKKKWQLVFLNFEKRKKLSVVITAVEDRLPVISAGDDMIETACDLNSGFPRHGGGCYCSTIPASTRTSSAIESQDLHAR